MANLLKRARRQSAIYWSQISGTAGEYGRRSFNAPVQILCRWDDVESQVKNREGNTVVSRATVIVDRDMKPGDMLQLGVLDSGTLLDPNDSGSVAIEIIAMERIPPMRRGETAYFAKL